MIESASLYRPFLSTKLNPPTTTPAQVPRDGIWDKVRSAQSMKLILVRAPAGFGKTTAMVQFRAHLEENHIETAWMTLDGGDNDASRFLACLSGAVSVLTGDRDEPEEANLLATGQPLADMALSIIDRLAKHSAPFALFLDDFETLQEPTVLRLVRELLDNLPRRGQLIIGSRGLPDLGLGRLRARGHLLEIDATQLRFTLQETTEFVTRRRRIALPEEELSLLHRKTEGWVAALWLASMALEGRDGKSEFIARFSGSNEAVADYLAEDVLASQPPAVRDFLLRTSILRHLNASLCNALLPGADSGAVLRQLEESNLFLTPIEGEERSYRYHSLFAGFLRAQLERELPRQAAQLHRAASHWYESCSRPVPAIDHAIEGGNYEHAVRLLELHAESLLEGGRMRLLARWFSALPDAAIRRSPLLQVIHVWAVCLTRGPWEAMAVLEDSGCLQSDDPRVLAHVLALRPMSLAMMDRKEDAHALGREALARLPLGNAFADNTLANEMAYIFAVMGDYQASHKLLDSARRGQGLTASAFHKMYSESVEGIIDLEEAQLRQATARFRIAVSSTHSVSYRHTGGNAWAGVLYAATLYEANDLGQAEHLLQVYVPLAKDVGLPDHMIIGYTLLSRVAFHRGDIDQSFQWLTEMEYIGHRRQLPRVVSSAKLERARILALQGNIGGAQEEFARANTFEVWERVQRLRLPAHDIDNAELGAIRLHVFTGNGKAALQMAEPALAAAIASKRLRRALKLRVLRALAEHQSGDLRTAVASMTDMLKATCSEGFIRLIVDEGERAGQLVREVEEACRAQGGRSDPIFSVYLQKLLEAFGPVPAAELDMPAGDAANVLVEQLTAKEIRILSLLAEGYSNSALAEKLFVSDSTVRTHLRNINGKLNAHNRTQAVAVARKLGVIR
ncbi:LuxR C-terminal-related transcriptional regulator [Noviherbaspirillum pedocola]|uniref:Helix-turn-helix transcriptional regulator n=1 Tax=Noviherbaspirillum pedocola TaxID=2801341 RepID=A0A934SZQ0_9BURK|nr:LuxR C-terminal-related transcriptional regulator [Noviherbaspirillum pedocola]MBK4738723.1 helix-turn-helix transcriptional regulator [Noviherbaspirillum pedocola]